MIQVSLWGRSWSTYRPIFEKIWPLPPYCTIDFVENTAFVILSIDKFYHLEVRLSVKFVFFWHKFQWKIMQPGLGEAKQKGYMSK